MRHHHPARRVPEDGVCRATHHKLSEAGMAVGTHHQEIGLVRLDVRFERLPVGIAIQQFEAGLDAMHRQVLRQAFSGRRLGLGVVLDHREDTNAPCSFQERMLKDMFSLLRI